jgi:hypothetical protein
MYTVTAVFNSLSVCGRSRYTADFAALHYDEVQMFLGIFQQIAPALNWCIYCLLKDVFNKKNTFLN